MAKSDQEIAAEVVQELLKARGQAAAGIGSASTAHNYAESYLSDASVVRAFNAVFQAIRQSYNS